MPRPIMRRLTPIWAIESAPPSTCLNFAGNFLRRITFGREPEPGELLRWILHVNPFRREEDALHLAEGLRLAGLEGAPSQPSRSAPVAWPIANVFRREGALWTVSFDHQVAHIAELRGFHDIARLLARPGEELPSVALANQPAATGIGMEMIDEQARRAYRARLREIDFELEKAAQAHDPARAERLEEERDCLLEEIKKATGLGGRTRKIGAAAERARTAVTWRIRHAIKRLEQAHPALARHLANAIRTGAYCSYQPEKASRWFV